MPTDTTHYKIETSSPNTETFSLLSTWLRSDAIFCNACTNSGKRNIC